MIAWVLGACAGKDPKPEVDARPEVVASLAEHVTLAHYQDFTARSAELGAAAASFCDDPDANGLEATRDAWWAARDPWKRSEIANFGPVVEYPERLGPKLDDWPVNEVAVEDLVAGDADLDDAAFASLGTATRGLPVVEYLLWSGDSPLDALSADPRRCRALAGASADVAASAARLEAAWRDPWLAIVGSPDASGTDAYDTVQDALDEWVNRLVFTTENIRVTKLGKPAGDASGGLPQPDAIESRPSGRSLDDARDALRGARDIWTGDVHGDHLGVRDLVTDDALAERIDGLFDVSEQRLAEVPETLEDTIPLQPEIVARAQEALQVLQVAIQVDLAQELGVTLAFNDNDGD